MKLAITAKTRYKTKVPVAPTTDYFDLILTLDGNPISTLDNRWLAQQPIFQYYELTTASGDTLITLDGRILEAREPA